MSRKILITLLIGSVCLSLFTGCQPETQLSSEVVTKPVPPQDLALKFTPGETTTYRVSTKIIQDYKFERPALAKIDQKQNRSSIMLEFDQKIESIDKTGKAIANVTIKALRYRTKNKEGAKFKFDSNNKADRTMPLAKLIGKSYKIRLLSSGGVEVLDTKDARKTVTTGDDAKVAQKILNTRNVQKRHEILALPDTPDSKKWSRFEASHPLLLAKKTFEKVYALEKVQGNDAIVVMSAVPSSKSAGTGPKEASQMEALSNIFDTDEIYTGRMVLDLQTGKVKSYTEKLVANYIAMDPPKEDESDKGPDTLTMGLTTEINVVKLD
ncbi:MAG: hypothetical protein ACYSWP_17485 [Planctomycetota bacterium]|jgi:hypothetical protein